MLLFLGREELFQPIMAVQKVRVKWFKINRKLKVCDGAGSQESKAKSQLAVGTPLPHSWHKAAGAGEVKVRPVLQSESEVSQGYIVRCCL